MILCITYNLVRTVTGSRLGRRSPRRCHLLLWQYQKCDRTHLHRKNETHFISEDALSAKPQQCSLFHDATTRSPCRHNCTAASAGRILKTFKPFAAGWLPTSHPRQKNGPVDSIDGHQNNHSKLSHPPHCTLRASKKTTEMRILFTSAQAVSFPTLKPSPTMIHTTLTKMYSCTLTAKKKCTVCKLRPRGRHSGSGSRGGHGRWRVALSPRPTAGRPLRDIQRLRIRLLGLLGRRHRRRITLCCPASRNHPISLPWSMPTGVSSSHRHRGSGMRAGGCLLTKAKRGRAGEGGQERKRGRARVGTQRGGTTYTTFRQPSRRVRL